MAESPRLAGAGRQIDNRKRALTRAYRQTTYVADIEGSRHEIRIGRRHRRLDAQLLSRRVTRWACITAWNPQSRRLSGRMNRTRHALLEQMLQSHRIRFHPIRATADAGDWPTETGVLALGVSRARAARIGGEFQQLAIVWGQVGAKAELVWCRSTRLVARAAASASKVTR
jgi:hypothetical protein